MKVVINAVSAKLGGAATYVRNLAASLLELAPPADEFIFLVPPERAAEMPREGRRLRVESSRAASGSYAARWWWEQVTLRRVLERERPDALFSSANFAMLACPCPQALLVRIPIYFDSNYLEHVLPQKSAAFRAETALRRWLVCRSVRAADTVMTPSAAMRDDLARFARLDTARTFVNPYGVPRARLAAASPGGRAGGRVPRILWVSHYAEHKNLATLLRAALRLRARRPFELWLTLDGPAGRGQHTPLREREAELLAGLNGTVKLLGVRGYDETWRLYPEADIFVFPSLCESFGHPLVEAMASGLCVVASDIAVHREICGPAADYFPVLDDAALAAALERLLADAGARESLAARGRARVRSFLWEDHVARLHSHLRRLCAARARAA
jgi:glycosyltransferase involved in cell wall biosynthesis